MPKYVVTHAPGLPESRAAKIRQLTVRQLFPLSFFDTSITPLFEMLIDAQVMRDCLFRLLNIHK